MKKIILIIMAVVTMLGISACGDKQSNQSTELMITGILHILMTIMHRSIIWRVPQLHRRLDIIT